MSTESPVCETAPLNSPRTRSGRLRRNFVGLETAICGEMWHAPVVLPLVLLLAATAIFRFTSFDLYISGLFYSTGVNHWPHCDAPFWDAFDAVCVVPAILLGVIGCLMIAAERIRPRRPELKRAGLFLLTVLIVGPGLIVNFGFKWHWGRPRPRETAEFGGPYEFTPVLQPGDVPHRNSSFPSGHAAVGFYLMVPAFLIRRRRRLARLFLWGGITAGVLVSVSRIVQGGHFVSDVVWSAAVVYFTAFILARLLLHEAEIAKETPQGADGIVIPRSSAA